MLFTWCRIVSRNEAAYIEKKRPELFIRIKYLGEKCLITWNSGAWNEEFNFVWTGNKYLIESGAEGTHTHVYSFERLLYYSACMVVDVLRNERYPLTSYFTLQSCSFLIRSHLRNEKKKFNVWLISKITLISGPPLNWNKWKIPKS